MIVSLDTVPIRREQPSINLARFWHSHTASTAETRANSVSQAFRLLSGESPASTNHRGFPSPCDKLPQPGDCEGQAIALRTARWLSEREGTGNRITGRYFGMRTIVVLTRRSRGTGPRATGREAVIRKRRDKPSQHGTRGSYPK